MTEKRLPPSQRGSRLPDRKVVAAAIATLVTFVITQAGWLPNVPTGVEGALAVVVAYLWPNS